MVLLVLMSYLLSLKNSLTMMRRICLKDFETSPYLESRTEESYPGFAEIFRMWVKERLLNELIAAIACFPQNS